MEVQNPQNILEACSNETCDIAMPSFFALLDVLATNTVTHKINDLGF